MFPFIFFFIILYFVAEGYILVAVSSKIGVLSCIALLFFSGIVGLWIIRIQGLSSFSKIQASLAQKEEPNLTVLNGLLLLIAGILLIIPGFITDIIGLALLIPFIRHLIVTRLNDKIKHQGISGNNAGTRGFNNTFFIFRTTNFNSQSPNSNLNKHGKLYVQGKVIETRNTETKPNDSDVIDAEFREVDKPK